MKPSTGPAAGRQRRRRFVASAYTLVEMLTTVAVLVILLGLMVSLARYVRDRSANVLTTDLLAKLEHLAHRYHDRYGADPNVFPLLPQTGALDEQTVDRNAQRNNRELVRAFRGMEDLSQSAFKDLPITIYDEASLRDAWGNPIVYMPRQHPLIGMAPGNRPFFLSAGPDRKFLTRDDNLYSYETVNTSP